MFWHHDSTAPPEFSLLFAARSETLTARDVGASALARRLTCAAATYCCRMTASSSDGGIKRAALQQRAVPDLLTESLPKRMLRQ
jgi:hypothetical protein